MKRRHFICGTGAGLLGTFGWGGAPSSWRSHPAKRAVPMLKTARNLITILLEGAPSHVDTFDLKVGSWTPDLLGVETIPGWGVWPTGIMPRLAERTQDFALVRSLTAAEAVHARAVYHLMTSYRNVPDTFGAVPLFSAMLSYALESRRRPEDSLPTVLKMGPSIADHGFLSIEHNGLSLNSFATMSNLSHSMGGQDLRFRLLSNMRAARSTHHDARDDQDLMQREARRMMQDEELLDLLPPPSDQIDGTQQNLFRRQCETAARVLAADKGTRVVQMRLVGWDHHDRIYNTEFSTRLPNMSDAFDLGMTTLLDDLAAAPGVEGGSLLDETLVVAVGEFGRTAGPLNTSEGRDHYPYALTAMVAGGGVKGGRIVGATDPRGDFITDPGWAIPRFMTLNDLTATMFSTLGVDWTTRLTDTSTGREFEMVDSTFSGELHHIEALFE